MYVEFVDGIEAGVCTGTIYAFYENILKNPVYAVYEEVSAANQI